MGSGGLPLCRAVSSRGHLWQLAQYKNTWQWKDERQGFQTFEKNSGGSTLIQKWYPLRAS